MMTVDTGIIVWIASQQFHDLLHCLIKISPQRDISQGLAHMESTLTHCLDSKKQNMAYWAALYHAISLNCLLPVLILSTEIYYVAIIRIYLD